MSAKHDWKKAWGAVRWAFRKKGIRPLSKNREMDCIAFFKVFTKNKNKKATLNVRINARKPLHVYDCYLYKIARRTNTVKKQYMALVSPKIPKFSGPCMIIHSNFSETWGT